MHINVIKFTLNYKRILYTEVAYTNYFISSLNIYTNKTLVFNFGALFIYPSINRKPYYNSSLSLNESIDLISTGL